MNAQRKVRPFFDVLEDRTVPALLASEYHINTTTEGTQTDPAIAMSKAGNSTVAWASYNSANTGSDVYFQRLDAAGAKVGSEVHLTNSGGYEFEPKVCMDDAGNFVIAWTVIYSTGNRNIQFARFNASGALQGSITTVAWTPGREYSPSIACSAAGEFVITFTQEVTTTDINLNVVAKRYSPSGTLLQTIQVANSAIRERSAQVARSHGSNAVFEVIYQRSNDIYLKKYSATGSLLTTTVIANTTRTEAHPAVAIDNAGNAVTAWAVAGAPYANGWWVEVRRLSKDGVLGPAFPNRSDGSSSLGEGLPYGADQMFEPRVAMNPLTGDFAVAVGYSINEVDPMDPVNFYSVLVTQYKANGVLGPRASATGYDTLQNSSPGAFNLGIASSQNGSFFVTYKTPSQDDPKFGIFGKRGTF